MQNLQLNNLSLYYKQVEIIRATADQIVKDFEIFGEKIEFSGNADIAYNDLKLQILSIISKLIKDDFQKFVSLLYRIDLNEKKVKGLLKNTSGNFEEIISEMIIDRELKKVLTRKYFSK